MQQIIETYCLQKYKDEMRSSLRALFRRSDPSHNFASKDCLDLTNHQYVKKLAIYYSEKWGVGSLPTRPIKSYEERLFAVQKNFASLFGSEEAAFFLPSEARIASLIFTLLPKSGWLLQDRHSLSPLSSSHHYTSLFDAGDLSSFELLLTNALRGQKPVAVFTESISSRTGKLIDLDHLISLKKKYPFILIVDDSLSFGLYGKNSLGCASFKKGIDLTFGFFSKTFGAYASYIASDEPTKHFLFQKNPALLSDSLIPPLLLGMIDASIQLIPGMDAERACLKHLVQTFKGRLLHTKLSCQGAPFFTLPFNHKEDFLKFQSHLTDSHSLPDVSLPNLMRFFLSARHLEPHLAHLATLFDTYTPTPHLVAL